MSPPYTDNDSKQVRVHTFKRCQNITVFHNHPNGTACSVKDVETLINLNRQMEEFESIYVYVSGKTYVIYIYDRQKMLDFRNSSNFSSMPGQYSYAFGLLRNTGYAVDVAHLYAIAYMLQELDTGIAILSKADGESVFHQHRASGQSPDEWGLPQIIDVLKCK